MSATLIGRRPNWSMARDKESYRTYKVIHRVATDDKQDGPHTVFNCPGLPLIGSIWNFGNDQNIWAFCWPDASVKRAPGVPDNQHILQWDVENMFSTKPRSLDEENEDPLLEPQKVSGSFIKYTTEASRDRNGDPIESISGTLLRGPNVEFDASRPTVRIEQNMMVLGLPTFSQMVNTVNSGAMWGLSARCVKLSSLTWDRKWLASGMLYYTRIFDFDINYATFDRIGDNAIIDESPKALGRWNRGATPPTWEVPAGYEKTNPLHFNRFKDANGENATTVLDSAGKPWDGTGDPHTVEIEYYAESNFFLLGVPTSF